MMELHTPLLSNGANTPVTEGNRSCPACALD